jgi:hypothetical protein
MLSASASIVTKFTQNCERKIMLNNTEIIILVPIFVILLLVIFKPIKAALNLGTFPSFILTVCVSALCIIGMIRSLKSSLEIILLPYTAMAIAIFALLLIAFFSKYFRKRKDYLSKRCTKCHSETEDGKLKG